MKWEVILKWLVISLLMQREQYIIYDKLTVNFLFANSQLEKKIEPVNIDPNRGDEIP